jgi:putative endonuclease
MLAMPTDDRKAMGARCEALAAEHLAGKGLRVRQRNFRCKLGEVDLICEDGATLVFVEVKARRGTRFGGGAEAVDARKQARLMAIATMYMAREGDRPCRFDVVAVTLTGSRVQIEHLPNAFP